jgi:hypothetical protein
MKRIWSVLFLFFYWKKFPFFRHFITCQMESMPYHEKSSPSRHFFITKVVTASVTEDNPWNKNPLVLMLSFHLESFFNTFSQGNGGDRFEPVVLAPEFVAEVDLF